MTFPKKIPPPAIALGLLTIAYLASRFITGLPTLRASWSGWLLMAGAVVLALHCLIIFLTHNTTVHPHGEPSVLIIKGPYCWSRNPMYLALATLMLGVALVAGKLAFFLVLPVFVGIINRIQIPVEEEKLAARFGETYERYRLKVPRWI